MTLSNLREGESKWHFLARQTLKFLHRLSRCQWDLQVVGNYFLV